MSIRAGIIVTGTEVLSGRITDRNGPWVAEQLLGLGVDVAHLTVCGDRPDDLTAQLAFLTAQGVGLIVTTGGLGPTADDLTVQTVAEFRGDPLRIDSPLESHIEDIIRRWRALPADLPLDDALRAGVHKQALIPLGAEAIPPTGTAPGIAIPAVGTAPAVLILPGPPAELRAMWTSALETAAVSTVLSGRDIAQQETIRAYGLSEADLAATLRIAQTELSGFDDLEITTCLRRGEVEMVTRFADRAAGTYGALSALMAGRHGAQIFSDDGATIDDLVAASLDGHSVATAESCTGGLVAARLTDRAGSSAYVMGGVVSYSNAAKTELLGVPDDLITDHGAVSEEVAAAMADGALRRFGTDTAISTTGVAGPGGGSAEKPVGTVCFGLAVAGGPTRTHTRRFPGDRSAVRELSTTAAFHLLRTARAESAGG